MFSGLVVRAERAQCLGSVEEQGHEAGTHLQGVPLHVALAGHFAIRHCGQHLLQAVAKLEQHRTADLMMKIVTMF